MAIAQRLQTLSRRPEARHAGLLISGSMAAQVALLATAPLLARLFPPQDFGIFSLMLIVSTIGGSIGGLCYEVAVILPRSRLAAVSLYRLAFLLSLLTPFLTVGLVALVQHLLPGLMGAPRDVLFYVYCIAGAALTAQLNLLGYGHSRAEQYEPVSVNKLTQALLPALAQIGLALIGMTGQGLMLGRVLGLWASAAWLSRGLPSGYRPRDLFRARPAALWTVARTYRDFLTHVPRQLLVRGSSMLPAALLLGTYGPTVAGLYFFAQRLIERPGMLLGDSLTRVPMKQFAKRVHAGRKLTRAALLYTAAVSAPVLLGVALLTAIAHPLFRIVFGPQWEGAADYALVLAGWAAIRMISLPMGTIPTVLRKQKLSFWMDAAFALRVLLIPALAAHGAGPLTAIGAFCGVSVVYHLSIMALGWVVALRHDRTLQPAASVLVRTGETYV